MVTSRKRDQHRIFPTPLLAGMRNAKDTDSDDNAQTSEHWLERQISKKPKIDAE